MTRQRITLIITNFGCEGSGAVLLERALMRVPCVTYAYVNPATEMAYIEYDAETCTPEMLIATIVHSGFGARMPRQQPTAQPAGAYPSGPSLR